MALNFTNYSNLTSAASQFNASLSNVTGDVVSQGFITSFFTQGIPAIFIRFWELIAAPFKHSHMQWIMIPLIFTFLLTEFYFFRHTDEELGWNAALVNSLVLVFVAIDMVKTVFPGETPWQVMKAFWHALSTGEHLSMLLTIIFIGLLGLALVIINYFHLLPRRLAYLVSSHAPINFIAYFAIVVVYSEKGGHPLPLDAYTVIAATLLFTLVVGIIFTAQQLLGTKSTSYYTREG